MTHCKVKAVQPEARVVAAMLAWQNPVYEVGKKLQ